MKINSSLRRLELVGLIAQLVRERDVMRDILVQIPHVIGNIFFLFKINLIYVHSLVLKYENYRLGHGKWIFYN